MKRKHIFVTDAWFNQAKKQKDGFGVSWPQAVMIRDKLLFGDFSAKLLKKRGKKNIWEVEF